MADLSPLESCVIAETRKKPFCGNWESAHPTLIIDELNLPEGGGMLPRIFSKIRRLAGLDDGSAKSRAIAQFLSENGVEVFMGEYLDFSLYYLPICKSRGIRFFAHAHGYDVSSRLEKPSWVKRYQLLNQADGIITMSQFSKVKLEQAGIRAPIHVIPYGVLPQPARDFELKVGMPVKFLFSGRFVAKKAPLLVIRAFARAFQEVPGIQLTMVGGGDLLEQVKRECMELGMEWHVEFTGPLPNEKVLEIMRQVDVYIQHSVVCAETGDMEGLPVAILEAMASGLPIVSTRHAGIPEAVIEGENGYLVEEGDVEAMAERMVFLAENPAIRLKISAENQEVVSKNFLWEVEKSKLRQVMGI